MNNKYGCGCEGGGVFDPSPFVPVTSNWDFNMDGCQRQRQNRCNPCQEQYSNRDGKHCAGEQQAVACQDKKRCAQAARCETNACTGRADCACDACMRRREAECNACNASCTASRKNACTGRADCVCDTCMRRREAECTPCVKQKNKADNRGVGIVWAKWQELDAIFDSEHALMAGTLFPELHKPMNGYWPCEENCADCKQEAAFMLWELRLYLNTHPCDQEALALFRQLREKAECTYAEAFLPKDCARWAWTDDPWPWEYDCACHR